VRAEWKKSTELAVLADTPRKKKPHAPKGRTKSTVFTGGMVQRTAGQIVRGYDGGTKISEISNKLF